jgi:hypothetical protein
MVRAGVGHVAYIGISKSVADGESLDRSMKFEAVLRSTACQPGNSRISRLTENGRVNGFGLGTLRMDPYAVLP